MTYSEALDCLNEGQCVSRVHWFKEGEYSRFVCKQIPAVIGGERIVSIQSLPDAAKNILTNWKVEEIKYINQLIIVSRNGCVTYYIPRPEDIFASDWILYE